MVNLPTSIDEIISKTKKDFDSEQKLVDELLNNKNLESKTDFEKPIKWAILKSIAVYLESKGLVESARTLNGFIEISEKMLISKNREGRKEVVQILNSFLNERKTEQESNISMKVK